MKHLSLPAAGLVVAVALALAACSKAPDAQRRPPPAAAPTDAAKTAPAVADHAERHRLEEGEQRRRHRGRVRGRPRRDQAGVPLLGREVVPAVQPGPGDALQPSGLHRALARLRAGVRRRRQPRRAKARHALSRQRLSDHADAQAERRGSDPPARRGRPGPLHRAAQPRHERRPAGQGGAGRRARRRQGPEGERLAPARLLFLGHRPDPGARQGRGRRRPWPSSPPPARPTSRRRRCAFASRRWPRARPRRRPPPTSRRVRPFSPSSPIRSRRARWPTCSSTSPTASSAPSRPRARPSGPRRWRPSTPRWRGSRPTRRCRAPTGCRR